MVTHARIGERVPTNVRQKLYDLHNKLRQKENQALGRFNTVNTKTK